MLGVVEVEKRDVVDRRDDREGSRLTEESRTRREAHADGYAAQTANGTARQRRLLSIQPHHLQIVGVVEHGAAGTRRRGSIGEDGEDPIVGLGELVVAAGQIVAGLGGARRGIDENQSGRLGCGAGAALVAMGEHEKLICPLALHGRKGRFARGQDAWLQGRVRRVEQKSRPRAAVDVGHAVVESHHGQNAARS